MNDFLEKKFNIAIKKASSKQYKSYIANQFYLYHTLNIDNDDKLRNFHYISQFTPFYTKKVLGSNNDKSINDNITKYVYKQINAQSNEITDSILKQAFVDAFKANQKITKIAYPNINYKNDELQQYNLNKWTQSLQDAILQMRVYGVGFYQAINYVTGQWSDMDEKIAFERWANYYNKGTYNVYKVAQLSLQVPPGFPGYIAQESQNSPSTARLEDILTPSKLSPQDDFENMRSKIVGRINSAKRLLNSKSGRNFAGRNYEHLLETLLMLEKDLYNIKTASMLNDVILRALNGLKKNGVNDNCVVVFNKIAQLPPPPPPAAPGAPVDMANNPTSGSAAPVADPQKAQEAVDKFIDNLSEIVPEAKNIEKPQLADTKKDTAVSAPAPVPNATPTAPGQTPPALAPTVKQSWLCVNDDFNKFEKIANNILKIATDTKNHLYVTGQAAPNVAPAPVPPAPQAAQLSQVPVANDAGVQQLANQPAQEQEEKAPKEKTRKEKLMEMPLVSVDSPNTSKLLNLKNDVVEQALQHITLKDVTDRLGALSRVFKNREVARQLAIIDLMLDSLGISGFFPALAEATRSALESNQYVQSRVEEILSKLMSATDEHGQSLINNNRINDNLVEREMKAYMNDIKEKEKEEMTDIATNTPPAVPAPAPDVAIPPPPAAPAA